MPEPDPQPDAVPTPEPIPGAQAATPKRHTAPITPLVHMVRFLGVILVVVLVQFASAAQRLNAAGWLGGGALALLVVAVVGGLVYLQWRRLLYWFDDDGDLRVSSGIFQHRERRLRDVLLVQVDEIDAKVAQLRKVARLRRAIGLRAGQSLVHVAEQPVVLRHVLVVEVAIGIARRSFGHQQQVDLRWLVLHSGDSACFEMNVARDHA